MNLTQKKTTTWTRSYCSVNVFFLRYLHLFLERLQKRKEKGVSNTSIGKITSLLQGTKPDLVHERTKGLIKQPAKGMKFIMEFYFKSFKNVFDNKSYFCWRGCHEKYKSVCCGIIADYWIKDSKKPDKVSEHNKTIFFCQKKNECKTITSFWQSPSIGVCWFAGDAAALLDWETW